MKIKMAKNGNKMQKNMAYEVHIGPEFIYYGKICPRGFDNAF